jgi:hypothetical protein
MRQEDQCFKASLGYITKPQKQRNKESHPTAPPRPPPKKTKAEKMDGSFLLFISQFKYHLLIGMLYVK